MVVFILLYSGTVSHSQKLEIRLIAALHTTMLAHCSFLSVLLLHRTLSSKTIVNTLLLYSISDLANTIKSSAGKRRSDRSRGITKIYEIIPAERSPFLRREDYAR